MLLTNHIVLYTHLTYVKPYQNILKHFARKCSSDNWSNGPIILQYLPLYGQTFHPYSILLSVRTNDAGKGCKYSIVDSYVFLGKNAATTNRQISRSLQILNTKTKSEIWPEMLILIFDLKCFLCENDYLRRNPPHVCT